MGPGEIKVTKNVQTICFFSVKLVLPNFSSILLIHIYITLSKASCLPQLLYLLQLSLAFAVENKKIHFFLCFISIFFIHPFLFSFNNRINSAATV